MLSNLNSNNNDTYALVLVEVKRFLKLLLKKNYKLPSWVGEIFFDKEIHLHWDLKPNGVAVMVFEDDGPGYCIHYNNCKEFIPGKEQLTYPITNVPEDLLTIISKN